MASKLFIYLKGLKNTSKIQNAYWVHPIFSDAISIKCGWQGDARNSHYFGLNSQFLLIAKFLDMFW